MEEVVAVKVQVAAEMVAEGCQVEAAMAAVVRVWEAAVRVEEETEAVAVGRVRAVEVTVLAVVATGEEAAGMAVVEMAAEEVGTAAEVAGMAAEEVGMERGVAAMVLEVARTAVVGMAVEAEGMALVAVAEVDLMAAVETAVSTQQLPSPFCMPH